MSSSFHCLTPGAVISVLLNNESSFVRGIVGFAFASYSHPARQSHARAYIVRRHGFPSGWLHGPFVDDEHPLNNYEAERGKEFGSGEDDNAAGVYSLCCRQFIPSMSVFVSPVLYFSGIKLAVATRNRIFGMLLI